ncbi:BQ2448_2187 [Microbotryum intermedium]|uniref:BQ2448_2187 protein n=1 Tax=Microbotryum intermedium TaxID=269621 RepID=A0A238F7P0_9BASI|nr:BQ2448_2187 [Microbotryum intermedium]
MSTHHQIQLTSRHQPAQATIAPASTSKVEDAQDPVSARSPLFAHAYHRGKPAQRTTSAVLDAAGHSTSTTRKKVSIGPGGSTFRTPFTFKPKHGPLRSVHATLSDARLRARPKPGGPDHPFDGARRLPQRGAEQLVIDDEEEDEDEMESEDDDDDGFETTSDEEEDEDEDMYDVQMGQAQDDSGVGLQDTRDMYDEEFKRKIRALERGPLINAYQDNLELATAQYSHVLDDMKLLLKRDLGEEVGQELRTQIEGALEHRRRVDEALVEERDHFVINVAEANVTQAQDLINQLYELHKQKIESHKLYERNITSARDQTRAEIAVLTKKYEQESSKLLKKMSTPNKASSTGNPSLTSARAKGKGRARATR